MPWSGERGCRRRELGARLTESQAGRSRSARARAISNWKSRTPSKAGWLGGNCGAMG